MNTPQQISDSFSQFTLPDALRQTILKAGFTVPTAVQKQGIPTLLAGKDLIACAQTGSGKTAAFAIPLIARLMDDHDARALILAPTRELAQQISEVIRQLSPHSKGLGLALLIGGVSMKKQYQALKGWPRIIVATPGRLVDHLGQKSVTLDKTGILVLDEGDRMLDMGFAPQLNQILKHLPKIRQTSFFTATLDPQVRDLAEKSLYKPVSITVGSQSKPVETVTQKVIQTIEAKKNDKLLDELNSREGAIIIFTRTKSRTDRLCRYLEEYGYPVARIHGGRSQSQRTGALKELRDGKIRILVATDVAARGIDVPEIRHVINYDLPMMDEDYIHRIGRTARNGAEGEALSFLLPSDMHDWARIVRKFKLTGFDDIIPAGSSRPLRAGGGARRASGPSRDEAPRRESSSRRPDSQRREGGPRRSEAPRRDERPARAERPQREFSPRKADPNDWSDAPRQAKAPSRSSGPKRAASGGRSEGAPKRSSWGKERGASSGGFKKKSGSFGDKKSSKSFSRPRP